MKSNIAFLTLAVAMYCLPTVAGATDITLADLIAQSEMILYGHVAKGGNSTDTKVSFIPQAVLKGSGIAPGKPVPVCNTIGASDSFDLRAATKPLVVFAKSSADCLLPVHGIASTIVVSRGLAETAAIFDQPSREPISSLLAKIRHIVQHAQ
jgi:hypothetical protein